MKILTDAVDAGRRCVDTFLKQEPSKQVEIVAKVSLVALTVGIMLNMPKLVIVLVSLGAAFYYCSKERSAVDKLGDWANSAAQRIIS